ncbi:MAG: GNAT family N-acetyltransferase [Lachnospiraceae bacterium]|nr:GNAT family N-acetyltransferase [Lachnospiraceae bacterium]
MKFTYETDRLILRLLGEEEAPAVLQFYRKNRAVFEPYEAIHPEQFYTESYQRTLLNCELSLTLKHNLIRFYVFRRENPDEIIGTVCFRNIDRSTYYSCETGYRFSPAYWHKGYAREALAFGIQLMFEEFHLHRIEATVMPENTASIRLLESLTFQQEGIAREFALIQGKWEDHIRFALIRPSGDTSSQMSPLTADTASPYETAGTRK